VAAVFFGVAAWLLDPVGMGDDAGRVDRYAEGSPAVRGQRILSALRNGRTDFTGLDLRGTNFASMDLTGARFDDSKLTGSNFAGATLREVSLARSIITDVDFRGADLSTTDMDLAMDWVFTICDGSTRMPQAWACDEEGRPIAKAKLEAAAALSGRPPGRLPPVARPRRRPGFGDDGLKGNLGKAVDAPPPSDVPPETGGAAPNQPAKNGG
jgi:hypothetical protein